MEKVFWCKSCLVMSTRPRVKFDEHGQPVLVTSKGEKKLFTCRLQKLDPSSLTPKQIMERKKK